MAFSLHEICPARSSPACQPRIVGVGAIQDGDAQTLRAAIALWRKMGVQQFSGITLSSDGGSLVGGVQLGREIRAQRLSAIAPAQLRVWNGPADRWRERLMVAQVQCHSACVYAFLGGVLRRVEEGAVMGVHRFFDPGPAAGSGPAPVANPQVVAGHLAAYLQEMGARPGLLEVALATPAQQTHRLSKAEVAQLRLDNSRALPGTWKLLAARDRMPILRIDSEQRAGLRTFVSLANSSEDLVVHLVLRPPAGAGLAGELAQGLQGRAPRLVMVAGGKRLELESVMPWTRSLLAGGGEQWEAIGALLHRDVPALVHAGSLSISDAGWGGAWALELGVLGLSGGVRALTR